MEWRHCFPNAKLIRLAESPLKRRRVELTSIVVETFRLRTFDPSFDYGSEQLE